MIFVDSYFHGFSAQYTTNLLQRACILSEEKIKKHFLSSEHSLIMTFPQMSCVLKIDVLPEVSKVKCGLLLRNLRYWLFSLLVRSPKEMKILSSDIHGCE